jgi:hypothetical protein
MAQFLVTLKKRASVVTSSYAVQEAGHNLYRKSPGSISNLDLQLAGLNLSQVRLGRFHLIERIEGFGQGRRVQA